MRRQKRAPLKRQLKVWKREEETRKIMTSVPHMFPGIHSSAAVVSLFVSPVFLKKYHVEVQS
ncbi:hypothetical protein HUJ04_012329 [Dendroctonus ponderosae]|nr:hypothetical protein HUJ04_012329 [Dendroctonus ponderosae]